MNQVAKHSLTSYVSKSCWPLGCLSGSSIEGKADDTDEDEVIMEMSEENSPTS